MRLVESSTLSNQNIATALNVHTHTATADRLLFIRVSVDQIAGNGSYSCYATVQRLGAGSNYEVQPRTTATVASGVTSIMFVTFGFPVQNTDVIKVYVLGLGGDTTTPDIVTGIWEDDSLRPTTADRTLDVSSGGEAGIDLANVGNPTTTLNLSGTTVKAVTDMVTANVVQLSGDVTAADNAESFFDGTGYAGTGNVIPQVTAVTGAVGSVAGNVNGNVNGNVVGSVGSVAASVTLANNAVSAAAVAADAVAEIQSGLATAASIAALNNLSAAQVNTEVDTAIADAALATAANLATVDTVVDAIKLKTDNLPTDPADDSDIDAQLAAIAGYLDTEVAAIKAKTDNLPADTAAVLTIIDDFLDTEVLAIKAKTDLIPTDPADASDIAAAVAAIQADTDNIQTRLPAALASGRIPADVTAINGVAAAAAQLARSAATIVNGAATSTTLSTTQMSTDLTEATDDHYNGRIIIWTSGVLLNQATNITDYNGTTKTLTYTATTEAPANTDTFIIV